ncbi:MAG: efflux RND transporter periplasmic adaptor subunit [Planctomycetota bacterium]
MSKTRQALRIALPILVLALGGLGAGALIDAMKPPATVVPERIAPLVTTVDAHPSTWTPLVHASGSVAPAIESELVSEVAGKVVELGSGVLTGARFAAGELLVRIESRDYELAIVEADAAVAQAALAVELEEAEASAAAEAWRSLHPMEEPSPLVLRQPQRAEAAARLAAARARSESSRRDLERTTIRAPWNGFTFRKSVDLGQFVARGTNLAHLVGSDAAEVRLPLGQDQLALLDLDGDAAHPEVALHTDIAGRRVDWTGRIVRRDDWVDPKTRLASLVVRIERPFADAAGRPPMFLNLFVHAELRGRPVQDVFVLPRAALRPGDRVFTVDRDGHLRIRDVRLLARERDSVVLGGGITDGEQVCVTPLDVVTDGMDLRIAPATAEAGR